MTILPDRQSLARPRTRLIASLAACVATAIWFGSVGAGLAGAQVVTEPITYQGRLEQGGSPVSQVRDLRFELFANQQGGAALTSVDVTGVAIVGGLFTASVPFPAGSFEGPARFVQITLLPRIAGERAVVLPRQALGATPRAESVRGLAIDGGGKVGVGGPAGAETFTIHGMLKLNGAGAGIHFADGTVQTTAAVTPPPVPQLLYLPGSAPTVDLSGEPVTLVEPIRVSYAIVETLLLGPPAIIATVPGQLTVSPVVVRRPFTGSATWSNLYQATLDGPPTPVPANLRSVRVLSLSPGRGGGGGGGGANDCSFTLSNMMVVGHRVFSIGTTLFEELRLNQTTLTAPVPAWPSGATGNGGKFDGAPPLGVVVSGSPILGADVRAIERSVEATPVTSPGNPTTFIQGRVLVPNYVFRTAFGSTPVLGAWLGSIGTSNFRRPFSITGPGGFSLSAFGDTAWVHTYRVVPGPAGEIFEEWSVTHNFLR
ncbi:MAG: hypothetical protein MUE97_06120 [Phycisphaerales bacterium]|jgi:hypothetical protein|nr:hypothetical protein [Phycisphaerales bacterium]